jgi:hypothetical protein
MNRKILTLSFILMMFISQCLTYGQITADDYRKADDLVKLAADKVYSGNVRPDWNMIEK